MGIGQALLISLVMAILLVENLGYGHIQISRPIFAGPLIGLLMGDLQTGLVVGGTVELMFMGVMGIGGSVPPNAQFAGMMGTVLAVTSGSVDVGITLAYPIGIFAQFVILLSYNFNLFFIHRADREIAKGNIDAVDSSLYGCIANLFVCWLAASFLGCYLGSQTVASLYEALPVAIKSGLSIAGGIMPAVGMAMLLKMMNLKRYWSFVLIGYVLSSYLNMNILSMALLSFGLVGALLVLGKDSDTVDGTTMQATGENKIINAQDLKKLYWRSYLYSSCLNYERYQGLGFCYCMLPVLKKLYKDKDQLQEAVARNTEFFNTMLWMVDLILGITTAMEEEKASGNEMITDDAISATKAALMGPTAGFGDSFFRSTIITLLGAFAANLAIAGNAAAPLIFIIPILILMHFVRYYGVTLGYKYGANLLADMKTANIIDKLVSYSSIIGMIVTAGLIGSNVKVPLAIGIQVQDTTMLLADKLNAVLPKMLPFAITLIYYFIMKKNSKNGIYICLLITFVLGIGGKILGIF